MKKTSLFFTDIGTKKYRVKVSETCAVITLKDRSFESFSNALTEATKSVGNDIKKKEIFFIGSQEDEKTKYLTIVVVFKF